MRLCDYHIHSTFSDGENDPEDIVRTAIELGFSEIGFSDHSYTFFDDSYCLSKDRTEEYRKCIYALKEKYMEEISILCGIEQEYWSDAPAKEYDYIIGSLHYIKVGEGVYIPVDLDPETLRCGAEKYFDGDVMALCESYYETVSDVVRKTGCDIIGHIDLVTKFIEQTDIIDTSSERYRKAAINAADALLKTGKPFEINTGAISRGHRTTPYPENWLYEYIKEKGGKFILSSDSHKKENIGFMFGKYESLIEV